MGQDNIGWADRQEAAEMDAVAQERAEEAFADALAREINRVAVAAQRAADEAKRADSTEGRLERIEEKLDRILEKLDNPAYFCKAESVPSGYRTLP